MDALCVHDICLFEQRMYDLRKMNVVQTSLYQFVYAVCLIISL